MINFAVGPVQMDEEIRAIGAKEVPYFRTPEFSAIMKENERLMKQFTGAPEDARAVFLTGSGTAAMEAAVMNLFTERDRVLVVNGGSFGARFAKICEIHEVPHEEIQLESGRALRACAGSIKGKSGSGQKRRNRSIRQKALCLSGRLQNMLVAGRKLCSVCNSEKLHLIAQNLRKKNFLSCCQRSINEKSGRYL